MFSKPWTRIAMGLSLPRSSRKVSLPWAARSPTSKSPSFWLRLPVQSRAAQRVSTGPSNLAALTQVEGHSMLQHASASFQNCCSLHSLGGWEPSSQAASTSFRGGHPSRSLLLQAKARLFCSSSLPLEPHSGSYRLSRLKGII